MGRRWVALVACIIASMVAVSCSSGRDGATSTTPTSSATTVTEASMSSTPTTGSGDYDPSGLDVAALCVQLRAFSDRWDGTPELAAAAPEEKETAGRAWLAELLATSDRVEEIGPPGLARDLAEQVRFAKALFAMQYPAIIDATDDTTKIDLYENRFQQPRIDAFVKANCGFTIWDETH